jgi:hypothetical protein
MSAAVAFNNLADLSTSTISAQGFITTAPPSLLTNPHVGKKWRHNATSSYIIADLGAAQAIDTVMLAGLNLTAPTVRLRLSTADSSGTAGDIYDSGSFATTTQFLDPNSGLLIFFPTAGSARYVRIDLAQAAVSYIEAGRIFIGVRETFTNGLQTPWSRMFARRSNDVIGVGGQTFVDLRQGFRRIQFSFEFIQEDERLDFLETLSASIVNLGHLDALWIKDTVSTAMSIDSIWGYVDGDIQLTQNIYIVPPVYGAAFAVRQRL